MAEEYTQEQLEGLNRLHLRRIVKKMGMSADDAGDMKAAQLIEWILENQEEGGGDEKKSKKTAKKSTTKKKASARRAPPKRGKEKDPEPEPEETGEVEGDVADVLNAVADVGQKVDELGNVYNENNTAMAEQIGELQVEVYCVKGLVMKLFEALHAEEIIQTDGTEELEELEKECEGND